MRIAFTGHRPNNKYMGGYNYRSPKNMKIKFLIYNKLEEYLQLSDLKIITGGALGIDQMAFVVGEQLKNKYLNIMDIKLEVASPFMLQAEKWTMDNIVEYYDMLDRADKVVYVDTLEEYKLKNVEQGFYHPAKMQKRNEYMVDNCDVLIAVYDGESKGGTYNCIQYAKKKGKKIEYINIKEL